MPRQGLLHISENRRFGVQEKRMSDGKITIKSESQRALMRAAGELTGRTLNYIETLIKPGISTKELDEAAEEFIRSHGAVPSFLNYEGFPKSVCTSINDQVCHGIPSPDDELVEGDIVNVDCSTILNGYFSDSSRMFLIGNVDPEKEKLVRVTNEAVEKGLEQVKPWGFLGDMGQAVHDYAKKNGYTIVEEVGGHGVGLEFHEDPFVSYVTRRGEEMLMAPGMIFTIEPMINMGRPDIFVDDSNGWTIYTDDRLPSAQREIMVLVTETGHEVLAW